MLTRRWLARHCAALAALGRYCAALAAVATFGIGAAQAADKVSVSALTFVSSAPLFIAQDKGYFAKEGLEVEIKFFNAAQPVAVAVTSGDADFGLTGLTGGFFNLAAKGTLRIICAQSREEKGWDFSAYVVSNKAYAAGFKSLDQFPGHSFGLTQAGSTFHYMIGRLAEKRGFDLNKLTLTPLPSVPAMLAAVKSGQVDSVIAPAQFANAMQAAGEAKIIGWVHQETPWQLGAVFTSPKMIAERRPVVERFVKAWVAAAADYDAQFQGRDAQGKRVFGPTSGELIAIIEKYTKAKPEVIKRSLPYIDPQGRLLVRDLYEQVRWYQQQNLVDKSLDAKTVVDLSFVKGHLEVPK